MTEPRESVTAQAQRLRRAILQRHGYASEEDIPDRGGSTSIDEATRLATITTHWGIASEVPIFGRVIVLVQRVIRIGLRWYINPIVQQQNAFNDAVVRTLHELQIENDRLRAQISMREPTDNES